MIRFETYFIRSINKINLKNNLKINMEKYLKVFLQIVSILLVLLVIGTKNLKAQSYFIMVGKIYKSQQCGSASFSNAYAYVYEKRKGTFDYNQVKSSLLNRASNDYSASESDVRVETSRNRFACVIEYYKDIAGWNCSTKQYAVGFGTTANDAESDAVHQMSLYYKEVRYTVVKRIDADYY